MCHSGTDNEGEKVMTYIYKEVNENEFRDAFHNRGRGNQFSYEGLSALYEHLSCLADDMGEPIELDVIGLCCEWSEYDSTEEAREAYEFLEGVADENVFETLQDHTDALPVDDADGQGASRMLIREF